MNKCRGFEVVKGFENQEVKMPVRKTKHSAGYDIEAVEDCTIPVFEPGVKPTLIKTGIKAYMLKDEYLMLCNRSSNPFKKGLVLANSVGIIDCDYYGNLDNDGHIMFAFYNFASNPTEIKKGEAIRTSYFSKVFSF
ncbi:MAG: dUTP diphosphatase [Oscillospiraceae bacterium]|nr:dUTP diphosphatase [Oscillospiraceae bacterium]